MNPDLFRKRDLFNNDKEYPKLTYDPNLSLPAHVQEAARVVELYFKEQGIDSWELCGICSRDRLARLEEALSDVLRDCHSLWHQSPAVDRAKEALNNL